MYESPIIINVTDPIFDGVNKVQDEYIIRACQKIGADIKKEELIKALQYDRSQYEKGYADGLAYKPPVKTKADCIRSMTDEELAEMFLTHDEQLYRHCPSDTFAEYCQVKPCVECCDCKACWLDWLRQEIKEGE